VSTDVHGPVHALLWESSEACETRRLKASLALAAVTEVLRAREPLGGREREFLDLVARLEAEDPAAARSVWATPQAYVWVRQAYELVRNALQDGTADALAERSARPPLAAHLEVFKRFALAAALQGRFDLLFERPFEAALPLDLPDTPWSLTGVPPIATIAGSTAGCLLLGPGGREGRVPLTADPAATGPRLVLQACPVIDHAGCRIYLKPAAFLEPGLAGAAAPVQAGLAFHQRHAGLVREAVQAIHRHDPESFAHLRNDIAIIGLKPLGAGTYGNTSFSRMPGTFVTSPVGNPLALADDIIHETYHNRLFALEEQGRFFEGDDARRDARHYSPWRHDPRPLFGVFHAFYVFIRVLRFWRLVHGDFAEDRRRVEARHRGYVLDRILRLRGQLESARETLRNAGGFTPWGADVFAAMEEEFDRERARLDALALPDDAAALVVAEDGSYEPQCGAGGPLSVQAALREHRAGFDRERAHDMRSR
jgi:HEXXH motif-containing protein